MRTNLEKSELSFQKADARAQRLENLEVLLKEENVPARELLYKQLGSSSNKSAGQHENAEQIKAEQIKTIEGPGHEDFPVVDTGRVNVSNVQARLLRGRSLRIGLDLRNPDNEDILTGKVEAILATAGGARIRLSFAPKDVGHFRINRFKRTIMVTQLPADVNADNAQLILEVKGPDDETFYRNIFAIQH